jgi:hypothetical protein
VVLKNLKFSNQLQFRGGRQRQQRKLRSRRMIVCCEAAPDFDDAKKTQSAQLYGQIERVIADTAKQTRGDFMDSGRWKEIQV